MLELVTAAILALQPTISHEYAKQFARPIVASTTNIEDALVLVATIEHESSFRKAVAICKITGDEGRAIGSTQLLWYHWGRHTREQICSNPKLQFALTMQALGSGSPEERWARYMGRKPTNHEIQRRLQTLNKIKSLLPKPEGNN